MYKGSNKTRIFKPLLFLYAWNELNNFSVPLHFILMGIAYWSSGIGQVLVKPVTFIQRCWTSLRKATVARFRFSTQSRSTCLHFLQTPSRRSRSTFPNLPEEWLFSLDMLRIEYISRLPLYHYLKNFDRWYHSKQFSWKHVNQLFQSWQLMSMWLSLAKHAHTRGPKRCDWLGLSTSQGCFLQSPDPLSSCKRSQKDENSHAYKIRRESVLGSTCTLLLTAPNCEIIKVQYNGHVNLGGRHKKVNLFNCLNSNLRKYENKLAGFYYLFYYYFFAFCWLQKEMGNQYYLFYLILASLGFWPWGPEQVPELD